MKFGRKKPLKGLEVLVVLFSILFTTVVHSQVIWNIWSSHYFARNSQAPAYTILPIRQTFGNQMFSGLLIGSQVFNSTNGIFTVDVDMVDALTGIHMWKSRHSGFDRVLDMSFPADHNNDGIKDVRVRLRYPGGTASALRVLNGANGVMFATTTNGFIGGTGVNEDNPVTYAEEDINSDGKTEIFAVEGNNVSMYYIQ